MTLNCIQCHRDLRNARRDQPSLQTFQALPVTREAPGVAQALPERARQNLPFRLSRLSSFLRSALPSDLSRSSRLSSAGNTAFSINHDGSARPPEWFAIPTFWPRKTKALDCLPSPLSRYFRDLSVLFAKFREISRSFGPPPPATTRQSETPGRLMHSVRLLRHPGSKVQNPFLFHPDLRLSVNSEFAIRSSHFPRLSTFFRRKYLQSQFPH
jgi:hypothetical protein